MKIPGTIKPNAYFWPSIQRLNLIYHVCPLRKNEVWRRNVRQLRQRLRIFNGRKIVAVVLGDDMEPCSSVRDEFGHDGHDIELLQLPNDPELRETATFLQLLEEVVSLDEAEATFYAHTKGNSTRDNALGAEYWRNAMYHHLLDHVNVCRDLLLRHPCVGTHKIVWPSTMRSPFPNRLSVGNWMFAGTFFWFRHDAVFGHPNWHEVPHDRYGAEAWLSTLFEPDEAATVFQPWPASEYPMPSPYNPGLYCEPRRDPA